MRIEMKREQIGSAIIQSKWWMRRDEIMTPTLPSVSAITCSNTPNAQTQRSRKIG